MTPARGWDTMPGRSVRTSVTRRTSGPSLRRCSSGTRGANVNLSTRLRLGIGKLRRAYLQMLKRDYVRLSRARRRGECRRCGACCKLMFLCPYLEQNGSYTSCVCHDTRWANCKVFPVDERDLADRDLVSRDGPWGFSFEAPAKSRRRFPLVALVALAGLAAGSSPARAAVSRRSRAKPVALKAAFGHGRMPSGWRIESGEWEFRSDGIRCGSEGATVAALLREDMLPLARSDVRVEVWASLAPILRQGSGGRPSKRQRSRAPDFAASLRPGAPAHDVGIRWGGLLAGVKVLPSSAGHYVVAMDRECFDAPAGAAPRGRFRLEVSMRRGLVSVCVGGNAPLRVRDVYRRIELAPPRHVVIHAGPGVIVHAVRLVAEPAPARAAILARADRAFVRANATAAATLYATALADESLAPRARAEAAYKLGLYLASSNHDADATDDHARIFARACTLAPESPWAWRARLARGEAALAAGEPDIALAFAQLAAEGAEADVEDRAVFTSLVERASEALIRAGKGPQVTFKLARLAERVAWAGASGRLAAWAWEKVAESYDRRGLAADATAARRRKR